MADEQLERERKYDVEADYVLPPLDTVVADSGDRVEVATIQLVSIYFDTEQRDLLRHGITLRNRSGTTDNGWQLKVPTGDARTEIRLDPTARRTVPRELSALVKGLRRGRPLRQLVEIRSNRTVRRVMDADGVLVVEVADDDVTALRAGDAGGVARWREVEAELGPAGDERRLDQIGELLTGAGATVSDSANKVAKALDALEADRQSGDESEEEAAEVTAGDLISAYLRDQDDALVAGDLSLRRGLRGIHPTRVATRRMRSTLRIFKRYVDSERAQAFDAELSWYAALLGEVRDRQVQRERFAGAVAALPADQVLGDVADQIEEVLRTEEKQNQAVLERAMNGKRYAALLQESQRWATTPPFTSRAGGKASKLAKDVAAAAKKVDKHLAAGLASGDDEELHSARKAAKRARYASELGQAVLGKKTKKGVARYQKLQDILGEHQDGAVSAALLRRIAAATTDQPDQNGFTYGLLYADQIRRAETSRQQAFDWAKSHLS